MRLRSAVSRFPRAAALAIREYHDGPAGWGKFEIKWRTSIKPLSAYSPLAKSLILALWNFIWGSRFSAYSLYIKQCLMPKFRLITIRLPMLLLSLLVIHRPLRLWPSSLRRASLLCNLLRPLVLLEVAYAGASRPYRIRHRLHCVCSPFAEKEGSFGAYGRG